MNSLKVENLSFSYPRSAVLLENVTFEFGQGRTALLGPNGAGKSTLISLLASVKTPQNGHVVFNGRDSTYRSNQFRKYREQIAWLPQDFSPVTGLTVQEHVAYVAWLGGVNRRKAKACTSEALAQVGLLDLAHRKATELSGGQQRRLGLAGALARNASVILLDEPTAGLDPNQRETFRSILQNIAPETIVIVSTHQTEDIDGTFDSVFVLDSGQMKFQGPTDQFMSLASDGSDDPRDQIRLAYGRLVLGEA